jgi:hypothetical protein
MAQIMSEERYMKWWRKQLVEGGWDNMPPGSARHDDFDFVKKAHEADWVLRQGDVSKEYGALELSNAEALKFGTSAPPSLQNFVAERVSKAFRGLYDTAKYHGFEGTIHDYYSSHPDAYRMVMNAPVKGQLVFHDAGGSQTIGEMYPRLASSKTIGDMQSWLFSTVDPGFASRAEKLSRFGHNQPDVLQSMRTASVEALLDYQPYTYEGDRRYPRHYAVHAGWAAWEGASRYMEGERAAKGGVSSLEAIQESDAGDHMRMGKIETISGAGNSAPATEEDDAFSFYNTQLKVEYSQGWGSYEGSNPSSLRIGEIGLKSMGAGQLQEGDVILGWKHVQEQNPGVIEQTARALEAGQRVPIMIARPSGDASGEYIPMRVWLSGEYPSDEVLGRLHPDETWYEREANILRSGGGFDNEWTLQGERSRDVSYPTALWTNPKYAGSPVTFEKDGLVQIAPLSATRRPGYNVGVSLTPQDIINMGKLQEAGVNKGNLPAELTQRYKLLHTAKKSIISGLSGQAPEVDIDEFSSVDQFTARVDSMTRVRADSEDAPDLEESNYDPADKDTSVLGNDPDLGEYYDSLDDHVKTVNGKPFPRPIDEPDGARFPTASVETVNEPGINNFVDDFLEADPVMMARRKNDQYRRGTDPVAEVSEAASAQEQSREYRRANRLAYHEDLSARHMDRIAAGGGKQITDAMTEREQVHSRAVGNAALLINKSGGRPKQQQSQLPPGNPGNRNPWKRTFSILEDASPEMRQAALQALPKPAVDEWLKRHPDDIELAKRTNLAGDSQARKAEKAIESKAKRNDPRFASSSRLTGGANRITGDYDIEGIDDPTGMGGGISRREATLNAVRGSKLDAQRGRPSHSSVPVPAGAHAATGEPEPKPDWINYESLPRMIEDAERLIFEASNHPSRFGGDVGARTHIREYEKSLANYRRWQSEGQAVSGAVNPDPPTQAAGGAPPASPPPPPPPPDDQWFAGEPEEEPDDPSQSNEPRNNEQPLVEGGSACSKCGGSGNIPAYNHRDAGVCYRCQGDGVEPSKEELARRKEEREAKRKQKDPEANRAGAERTARAAKKQRTGGMPDLSPTDIKNIDLAMGKGLYEDIVRMAKEGLSPEDIGRGLAGEMGIEGAGGAKSVVQSVMRAEGIPIAGHEAAVAQQRQGEAGTEEEPARVSRSAAQSEGSFVDRSERSRSDMFSATLSDKGTYDRWAKHTKEIDENADTSMGAYRDWVEDNYRGINRSSDPYGAIQERFAWADADTRKSLSHIFRPSFHDGPDGRAAINNPAFRQDVGMLGASRVVPSRALAFEDELYGSGHYTRSGDREFFGVTKDGEQTMSQADVSESIEWARGAVQSSMVGNLPSDPNDIRSTVENRISNYIRKRADDLTKKLVDTGQLSEAEARGVTEAKEAVAKSLVKAAKEEVLSHLGASGAETAGFHAQRLTRAEQITDLIENNEQFAQKFAELGITPEKAASLPKGQEIVLGTQVGDTPAYYELGGGGDGFGGGTRRDGQRAFGSMWGGSVGRAFYGAYLFKRLWSMSAQPGIMEGEKYVGGLGHQFEMAAAQGDYVEGGTSALARRSIAQERSGKAAADIYGGFSDVGYAYSGVGGGALGRMGHYLGLAGGIAGGSFMAAQITGSMGMALPFGLTAATAGTLGLGVGAVIAGGALTMEAINQFAYDGRPVVTPGNLAREFAVASGRVETRREILRERGEGGYQRSPMTISEEELTERMSPETRALAKQAERTRTGEDAGIEASRKFAEALSYSSYESIDDVAPAAKTLERLFGLEYDLETFGRVAAESGLGTKELASGAEAYARSLGFKPKTAGFETAYQEYVLTDNAGRDTLTYGGRKIAEMGSQLQATMPGAPVYENLGAELVRRYDLGPENMPLAQSLTSISQQYMGRLSQGDYRSIAYTASVTPPHMRGVVSAVGAAAGMLGGDVTVAAQLASQMDIPRDKAALYEAMLGGDQKAMSFESWRSGDMSFRFYDRAGRPIQGTDGGSYLQTLSHWGNFQNLAGYASDLGHLDDLAAAFAGPSGALHGFPVGGEQDQAAWLFGFEGERTGLQSEIIDAFLEGGTRGVNLLARQKANEARRAQAGVQFRQIALTEQFYWGASDGGTWDAPTEGSSWGIEDRMLALRHGIQMTDFGEQRRRMNISNRFAVRREGIEGQRMEVSHGYNLWSMDFSYMQSLQQRGWTREDWVFQDTTRQLNFGWQMEDMDETIRYSTGRERRKAIRQQDRAALMHNLEGQQIDTQRERQEEQWSQEDERFQKQKDYTLELQRLDRESFDLGVEQRKTFYRMDQEQLSRKMEEYEQAKALQDELRELTREYQYEQLQLQKAAAGAAAQAAETQEVFNKALEEGGEKMDKIAGTMGQLNTYDKAFATLTGIAAMGESMNKVNNTTVYYLGKLMEVIGGLDPQRIRALRDALEEMTSP